jgi:hypothetical protein
MNHAVVESIAVQPIASVFVPAGSLVDKDKIVSLVAVAPSIVLTQFFLRQVGIVET